MPIIYLLLLIAAAVFYPLYDNKLSFILLITMLTVPVFLIIQLITSSRAVRVKLQKSPFSCIRGEKLPIVISIENPLFIPMGRIDAKISCTDTVLKKHEFSCGIKPRSSSQLYIEISPAHCGVLKISVISLRLYDIFGMFSHKLKFKADFECKVLPVVIPENSLTDSFGENGTFSPSSQRVPPGYDSLREYRTGDRIRDVHWKFSASREKIYVKEYEMLSEFRLLIIPDIPACKTRTEIDRVMDIFASIVTAYDDENSELIAVIPEKGGDFRIESARSGEDADDLIAALTERCFEPSGNSRTLCSEICERNAELPHIPAAVITPNEESSVLASVMYSVMQPLTVFNTGVKDSVKFSSEADYAVIEAGENRENVSGDQKDDKTT